MVEKELQRLQEEGVIELVNYSAWAAPIVVVKNANGKVYICSSTSLNDSLNAHQYPLPLLEDLFTELSGGICFVKVDLSNAFLQLEVDKESTDLLTINKELFRFNHLCFGVKPAPAIFSTNNEDHTDQINRGCSIHR